MRLIDADEFVEMLESYGKLDGAALLKDFPTAYDVDKVVERLEKMRDDITHNIALNSQGEDVDEEILNEISHCKRVIQIVKSGGIE